MLLAEIVATWEQVRATRSRLAKIDLLAALLGALEAAEVPTAVSYLAGELRLGRIGVGWATLRDARPDAAAAPTLTIGEVEAALADVAGLSGPGSGTRRIELLSELLGAATEPEQEFLMRLMLRDLRQGASEGVMVEAVARASGEEAAAVRRAVMVAGDLPEVAAAALGGGDLAGFRLTLFRPIQPMLAQTSPGVAEALERVGSASLEAKIDGARIQVHRSGDRVAVFTRNLREITGQVPEIAEHAAALEAEGFILDGEAVALGPDGRPLPFQTTMRRFGSRLEVEQGREVLPLTALYFDCLHHAGEDLIDRPGSERWKALEAVVPPENRVRRIVPDAPAEAREFRDEVLVAGHEGVMVKALVAPYEAGRRGAAWLKVKPAHTLDLVVLGAEWGSGRRRGWLSNLHLGARDPGTGGLVMLGKTFKGLTDELLEWQTARFLELETHREGHVVYVRPEQVVEVAVDGVQASSRYPGGVTLRFARVKGYRSDKSASEADTIGAVCALLPGTGAAT